MVKYSWFCRIGTGTGLTSAPSLGDHCNEAGLGKVNRLRRGVLKASQRAQDLTRDIVPVTRVGKAAIRAKTGLIGVDDKSDGEEVRSSVGWLVGWVENGDRQTVFALNLDIRDGSHTAARMSLAKQCLTEIGAL